jgi:hypothetical protein
VGSGGGLEGDLVAEALESLDEAALDGVAVALVEVGGAEVLVDGAVREQVVGDDEDGVANRDGGLLLAPAGGQAAYKAPR